MPGAPYLARFWRDVGFHGSHPETPHTQSTVRGRHSSVPHLAKNERDVGHPFPWSGESQKERRIMTEDTMVAPAPAASPAPSSAPAPAPVASPVAAPAAVSSVDPGKFPIREDYAAALLTEKLGAIAS